MSTKKRTLRIAINGFGRIGRHACKVALEKRGIDVVAINDLTDTNTLAHLFKYDTAYPTYTKKVSHDVKHLIIGNKKIIALSERDPSMLPWKKLKIDIVIEATGIFRDREKASLHLKAGAKKVIISAPSKGDDIAGFVRGVNCNTYAGED
ncbi:MAG: type I glyceraldehyde-3-phosphate dehydrogenase, partial [Candidatus Magasanikbacteria bacterium CG10_big_fil_rev_8_21_14_0_10_38_6]